MRDVKKLAVFDFDGTLAKTETIDLLAEAHGVKDRVTELTHQAMMGKLDFFGALRERVALLKGMKMELVQDVCAAIQPFEGVRDAVSRLKNSGYTVVVFSGGFDPALAAVQPKIGYDAYFGNHLHAQDGVLTGQVSGTMMFGDSKERMLLGLQRLFGITAAQTLVCGDGANDLGMFHHARIGVAIGSKGVLDAHASILIPDHDFSKLVAD